MDDREFMRNKYEHEPPAYTKDPLHIGYIDPKQKITDPNVPYYMQPEPPTTDPDRLRVQSLHQYYHNDYDPAIYHPDDIHNIPPKDRLVPVSIQMQYDRFRPFIEAEQKREQERAEKKARELEQEVVWKEEERKKKLAQDRAEEEKEREQIRRQTEREIAANAAWKDMEFDPEIARERGRKLIEQKNKEWAEKQERERIEHEQWLATKEGQIAEAKRLQQIESAERYRRTPEITAEWEIAAYKAWDEQDRYLRHMQACADARINGTPMPPPYVPKLQPRRRFLIEDEIKDREADEMPDWLRKIGEEDKKRHDAALAKLMAQLAVEEEEKRKKEEEEKQMKEEEKLKNYYSPIFPPEPPCPDTFEQEMSQLIADQAVMQPIAEQIAAQPIAEQTVVQSTQEQGVDITTPPFLTKSDQEQGVDITTPPFLANSDQEQGVDITTPPFLTKS
ncbi:MAG TPA: hypothetical protein P5543_03990, partial [Planctomycetota bacterium]|nr:hypothetical protein [Planctomycetota bacterium]